MNRERFMNGIKERLPGGKVFELRKNKLGNDTFLKLYHQYYNAIYFKGRKNVKMDKRFLQKKAFDFAGLRFVMPGTENDFKTLMTEAPDLLFPYRFGNDTFDYSKIEKYFDEGPYELNEKVCLRKGDIVIDCGANMGLFSNIALAKGCEVYAFEPGRAMIKRYLSKYKDRNLHIEEYALSDSTDEEIEFVEDTDQEGASCLAGIETRGGAGHYAFLTGSGQKKGQSNTVSYKVRTITLDEWAAQNQIDRIDFIKADIEGAERFMLMGGMHVLHDFAPRLAICTYHFKDDPIVLENIIRQANPQYVIEHKYKKMYAYVPEQ